MAPENIDPDLIIAYLNNELDVSQSALLEAWIDASEENRKRYEELKQAWELTDHALLLPADVDTDKAWQKLSARIENDDQTDTVRQDPTTKPFVRGRMIWRVAASLIPFLLLAYLIYHYTKPIEIQNLVSSEQVLEDTLPDGSAIQLNKNSSLSYRADFGRKSRKIELSGEAFFQVTKDPAREFIVHSGDIRVKVLGTSFYVQAYPDSNQIEVYVKSGKVAQYLMDGARVMDSIFLDPGFIGVYNKREASLTRMAQPNENPWYWSSKTLVFDRSALREVFKILEKTYGIDVIVMNDTIEDLRLTTCLSSLSIDQVMEIIAESFQLNITPKGNSYEIDAKQH